MRAADDALLFKTMIRGMARKHGLYATFLAKPYPEHSGSGAHVHFSVLDQDGNNIFDDGGPEGTDALRAAIAGCVEGLKELSLLLTPHGVSFDRLVEGAYAPTGLCWGYENRSVALRIPGGSPKARRIEHRVAGADVCPYLMLTGILGAALEGMDQNMTPPPPISGSAFDADLPMIPSNWDAAISAFESSSLARQIFDPVLHDAIVRTKRQEQRITENLDQTQKILMYLERV